MILACEQMYSAPVLKTEEYDDVVYGELKRRRERNTGRQAEWKKVRRSPRIEEGLNVIKSDLAEMSRGTTTEEDRDRRRWRGVVDGRGKGPTKDV